ncbi:MAG TPA: serine/threonine-protein kinase [Lacunisphaera sp.]|nr:serine/threonine-protein kinase [Lacunisphaera sp.]
MNPSSQPGRIKEVFEHALELPTPQARLEFAQQACGSDADLLARVQTLLQAYDATGDFLPASPAGVPTTGLDVTLEEKPGSVIGHYKLLQQIGEGGCGVVYMAAQEEPVRRRVALKVIKLGMDTKAVVARFEAERQALAMMDHPNIAKVFDAGTTANGRPYFVMELVRGIPITKYCDENNLPTGARLELFGQVCHAIQHAHQKGIIHRDIKPSNILVTMHDGVPVPKVIDFGIAKATQGKLTDQTLFTAFEQFIGTPAYMSPEQAEMSGLDIDTRSDIYSLGVLLYELLTGQPPFDPRRLVQAGIDEIRRQIREVEPPRPSTRLATLTIDDRTVIARLRGTAPGQLSSQLSGDLDWIVMKALEKNRTRRYESASAFAADLQRHLQNEPVIARPPSTAYLLQKLVRRHRVACVTAGAILVSLVGALAVSVWAYYNEKTAREFAVESSLNLRKASEFNQKIMIRAADSKRRADASDRQAAIDAAKSAYAVAAMHAVMSPSDSPTGASRAAAMASELAPTIDRLLQDATIPPEAKWDLCEQFGDLCREARLLPRAEQLFQAAVSLRRQFQGDGHPDLAPVTHKLIETLRLEGREQEAHRIEIESGHAQSAYLRSGQWFKKLVADAETLQATGHFAEAEAKLQEATQVAQVNPPARYNAIDDIGRLAWLRYEAGDLDGTRAIALRWIAAEKSQRSWLEAGPMGFLVWTPAPRVAAPYDAHTLLGLVALQRGDMAQAREHLIASADGLPRQTELDWRKLRLATALASAGDFASVQQFLQRIRPAYVDQLQARNSENTLFYSANSLYYFASIGRDHAGQLATWEIDLSAGRVPGAWTTMRDTQPPAPAFVGPPLRPVATLSLPPAKTRAQLLGSLSPFGLLLLGWMVTAAVPRMRPSGALSPAAGWWLLAFCLLRTAECFQFAEMLGGNGYTPGMLTGPFLSYFSWILLWKFIQALIPEKISRREARFMHTFAGLGAMLWIAFQASALVNGVVGIGILIFGVLGLTLIAFGLSLAVCLTAGGRIWIWSRSAPLPAGQLICLRAAVPLLMVHGFVSLFVGEIHGHWGVLAAPVFWANALLPWLLAIGFYPPKIDLASGAASAGA